MALFGHAKTDQYVLNPEQFMRLHSGASTLSAESVATFLGQVKDSASMLVNAVTLQSPDKVVADAISTRYETLAKSKEVAFSSFRHVIISKPESFKGLYVEYLMALGEVSAATAAMTSESTDRLRMLLASFINEYTDGRADSIYGYHLFMQEKKRLESLKGDMAKFFTAHQNKSKTHPDDVIRSFNDLPKLYDQLSDIGTVLSEARLKETDKASKGLIEMVDMLIEHNMKSGVLNKNNAVKKELMECIHVTAQLIEFYSGLFAQLMFFCGAFKGLTTALNDFRS